MGQTRSSRRNLTMSTDADAKAVTLSVRIYERLLALYPAAFRREYGPAMKQVFCDQCRDAWCQARAWGLAVLWLRLLPDLAKTSFLEHLSNLRRRESILMKMARAVRSDPRLRAPFIRAFAAVFALAIVWSLLATMWTQRVYSSTVRIEVQREKPAVSMLHAENNNAFANSDPYFMTTQFKIIESYSILTNVILKLRLHKSLPEQLGLQQTWTIDETFVHLSKMINVAQTRMTGLIEVSVNNQDPGMAAQTANAIADSYREARLEQWRQTHTSGIEAYHTDLIAEIESLKDKEEALDKLRGNLWPSEQDLEAFGKLKKEVESLWDDVLGRGRLLNQWMDKVGQLDAGVVIVRDPARIELRPVNSNSRIFLTWMCGGMLLALLAGGVAALAAVLISRFSHRQRAA